MLIDLKFSGSLISILFSTVRYSFSSATNLYNSVNLSGDAFSCLKSVDILVPFLPQTQQCHGLYPFLFSEKLTSNFGLVWWQKGQQ